MVHARYSRWNGPRERSLNPEDVFDQLSDQMDETGDLQQSMRRLMQRGMGEDDDHVSGLDDLLSQLAREKRRMYEQYEIRSALGEMDQKLQDVVSQERETLQDLKQSKPEANKKEEFLDQLSGKLSEAIEQPDLRTQ